MCLVSIAFRVHPDYPVILAGNREEYHERPSAAAQRWDDRPDIVGGRDLQAGGTWLAAGQPAHVAVVTNRPDLPAPKDNALSRGELVVGALSPDAFSFDALAERHDRYGGFSLLVANRSRLTLFAGGYGARFERRSLEPGVFGISNTAIDEPWPKVHWLNAELLELAETAAPDPDRILDLLGRDSPLSGFPSHGIPATPFVRGEGYGTRCSTVVLIRADGSGVLAERRFGPNGRPDGQSVLPLPPVTAGA